MDIKTIISEQDEKRLLSKVTKEYEAADNHTRTWKDDVREVGRDYLFPKPWEDKVKIRKIWNNLTIRKSVFLSDSLQVTNVPENWVLWEDIAKNCDKVFKANFRTMDIRTKYEEVLTDDALQWVWVLAVDWWNDHSQEPIVSYVDSRLTYPDPKNWIGNKMRYYWTLLRKSIYELESDDAYDKNRVQKVKLERSLEIERLDRANSNIKDFTHTEYNDELIDIYNHITVFKKSDDTEHKLYLTTWGADRTTLIRMIEMRALTDNEKEDPSQISIWVQLFRAKPIKWSYAWASLIDEIGQYQDLETLLTNLQIVQAKLAAVWGKTFVDARLWIDTDDLANNSWPWDVIPFSSSDPSVTANNWIQLEQARPLNPIIPNTIADLNRLAQEATNMSALVQGQSLQGDQTKSEVQTIQQNINQIISYMQSNYMESLVWLRTDIYKSYASYMSPQRTKKIVTVDSWNKAVTYWFKKNEFIAKWDIYIVVSSKAQEDIRKKQDFAVLFSVVWTLKQSVQPWSTQDVIIDRLLIDKSGIKWLEPEMIHPYTRDERIAYDNLVLLNNDMELKSKPEPWEDHNVFINIYKTWLDTDARNKAIELRELALDAEPKQPEAPQETWSNWWAARWLWASLLAQDNAKSPDASISDVAA